MRYKTLTREDFVATPKDPDLDKFANTFRAKADTMKLWPHAKGLFTDDGELMCAIIIRVTKRSGAMVANLQLLHTFGKWRRQGLARDLVLTEYSNLSFEGVEYFRVSSEITALPFYRSLGLKFWGEQKSGTLMCMHQIKSADPHDGVYQMSDPVVAGALFTKARGGIVTLYADGPI